MKESEDPSTIASHAGSPCMDMQGSDSAVNLYTPG